VIIIEHVRVCTTCSGSDHVSCAHSVLLATILLAMTEQNAKIPSLAVFYASSLKMPEKRKAPTLPDTPMHGRLASSLPFTSTVVYKDPVFVAAANEMKDKFVGGVSPTVFLDDLLSDCPSEMPAINVESFNVIMSKAKESEMYNPLVCVLCKKTP
jgi:hypothetical protein